MEILDQLLGEKCIEFLIHSYYIKDPNYMTFKFEINYHFSFQTAATAFFNKAATTAASSTVSAVKEQSLSDSLILNIPSTQIVM